MSSQQPHFDDQLPYPRNRKDSMICGAWMALVMATAGVVFVLSVSLGNLIFNSNRGVDWIVAEMKIGLKMYPLFGGFVGVVVGIILGAIKPWRSFPLVTGGIGGGLAGAVEFVIFATVHIAIFGGENLKFGVTGEIIFAAIIGTLLGICFGIVTGWTYRPAQRSFGSAVCRASACALVAGFLLALKG